MGDERILGGSAFVAQMLHQAKNSVKRQMSATSSRQFAADYIKAACTKACITEDLLQSGSRRHPLPAVRKRIAEVLVGKHGLSLAETARRLGVSTAAVAHMLKRERKE